MKVMFLINAGVGDCGGDDDVGNVVTREHDVGDHADAPEICGPIRVSTAVT